MGGNGNRVLNHFVIFGKSQGVTCTKKNALAPGVTATDK
jgi:hypothetical protein